MKFDPEKHEVITQGNASSIRCKKCNKYYDRCACGKKNEQPSDYFRPKTRGELVEYLRKRKACEVVSSHVETTCMLIDNWLNPPPYTVKKSYNKGWSVFELKPKDKQ